MNIEEVRVKALTLVQSRLDNYKSLSKKTDLQRTKEFLDSLGVLYSVVEPYNNTYKIKQLKFRDNWAEDCPSCDKIVGYREFYTQFEFDKDGNFLIVGAWE